jgi:GNAT superfamily N-acetyltransferase
MISPDAHSSARWQLREYSNSDLDDVRSLFVRVNRELAPDHLKQTFELYIATALREEIDILPQYYDQARGRSFWIGTVDGVFCGNFGLEPAVDSAIELRRMYIDNRFRGNGLGRWMLRQAESISRGLGWKTMLLSTSELQVAALSLYKSTGFELIGENCVTTTTSRTIGGGVRRFYFKKSL